MTETATPRMPDGACAAPERPRVLVVAGALSGGGGENHSRLLFANLCGGTADAATLHDGAKAEMKPGQILHSLGWRSKTDYPKAALRLRRLLGSGRYDAALSLGLYPNIVLWAASRGLRRRPALILTEITRPHAAITRFSGMVVGRLRHLLYRLSYGGADLVAANSEDGLKEVVTHYGIANARVRRVPNVIEVARVHALAAATPENGSAARDPAAARFCMVTRFHRLKRIDTLLRAAHALGREMDWRIDLVGDGVERPAIEALVAKLGFQDRVTLHGWMANPYPIMAAATATVLCSEYEGFSNTVLESMVIGTPVVTSFCSLDARMMVEEGAALGFEIGDWAALSGHLAALLREPGLSAGLRCRAERYAARHHADAAIAEYEKIVRDAIACRRQASHD